MADIIRFRSLFLLDVVPHAGAQEKTSGVCVWEKEPEITGESVGLRCCSLTPPTLLLRWPLLLCLVSQLAPLPCFLFCSLIWVEFCDHISLTDFSATLLAELCDNAECFTLAPQKSIVFYTYTSTTNCHLPTGQSDFLERKTNSYDI